VIKMLLVAHAGHTLVDLSIFLGPVAVVLGWIAISGHRERRRRREREGAGAQSRGSAMGD
jgi:hypothetical protein